MKAKDLTDGELLVLGLLAEMPRHGYELEQVIAQRSMREWTRIGFSSIYYVLGRLEARGLVEAGTPASARAKKSYQITAEGRRLLVDQTLSTLASLQPTYPPLLLGMLHWHVLARDQALEALKARRRALAEELARIERIHFEQEPLPDYLDAVFEYSAGQLKAEAGWIERTLAYMKTKAWEDQGQAEGTER